MMIIIVFNKWSVYYTLITIKIQHNSVLQESIKCLGIKSTSKNLQRENKAWVTEQISTLNMHTSLFYVSSWKCLAGTVFFSKWILFSRPFRHCKSTNWTFTTLCAVSAKCDKSKRLIQFLTCFSSTTKWERVWAVCNPNPSNTSVYQSRHLLLKSIGDCPSRHFLP